MKKHCNILLFVFILMLVGCGMFNGSSDYAGQRTDLYRVALYSFPVGEKFNRIKEDRIETDAYGRTLFYLEISPNNDFYPYTPDRDLIAAIIMQKSDRESIWFYEDECFILDITYNTENEKDFIFDQEKLNELKIINDWNQPFHPEKCSTRPYFPDGDDYDGMKMVSNYVEVAEGIRRYTKKTEDKQQYGIIDISRLSGDKEGRALYSVSFRENKTTPTEHFFVISDPEGGSVTEKNILAVDSLDFNKELHELKVQNDWVFGIW